MSEQRQLKIEYRKNDENNYFKGHTYFCFSFENKATKISIAPNETRKLNEIVSGIEKDLQDSHHLQNNERFEIDEFDKHVMDFETTNNKRIDNKLYNFLKMGFKLVQDKKATFDELIKMME